MLGVEGLKRICGRLSTRLQALNIGFNQHVSDLFSRAFVGREMNGGFKLNWKLTAAEQRRIFLVLPLCLPDLIIQECKFLNDHRGRPAQAPVLNDPSEEIIFCLASTLSWYQEMRSKKMSESDINQVSQDSGSILKLWISTFPSRDARLPKKQTRAQHTNEHMTASDSEDSVSSSSSEEDLTVGPHVPKKNAHQYPKAHAIMHVSASILLYGEWANCSAESLERKHVDIKDAAQQTNQRDGWLLQVLMRTKRESDIAVQASQMRRDEESIMLQCNPAGVLTPASFGDALHHSGLRMPVWNLIVKWGECVKHLDIRQPSLKIPWDSLSYTQSEVVMQCKEMMELPEAMAYYIQDTMLRMAPPGLWSNIPKHGALTTQEMYTLNKCIVTPSRLSRHSRFAVTEEHILCYNVMTIQHPNMHDCIIKIRAHPFR